MIAIGPCLEILPGTELKSFGLIPLVKEILRQPNIDCGTWLFVITLKQVYSEETNGARKNTKHIV